MRRDTHDEYGIPTCRYCGGPGTTFGKDVGFEMRKGSPVVRYRCAALGDEACPGRLQRRRCDAEWLLLGVISREDPLYYELRHQGKPSEGAQHTNARTRTGQAGKDLTSRPKRIGIPFMAYRAAAGGFLDVFRLCLWHGWLGSHPKPHPVKLRRRTGGEIAVASLRAARASSAPSSPAARRRRSSGSSSKASCRTATRRSPNARRRERQQLRRRRRGRRQPRKRPQRGSRRNRRPMPPPRRSRPRSNRSNEQAASDPGGFSAERGA